MTKKAKSKEKSPAQERAEIGTPAGEDPARGRERHGTMPKTEMAGASEEDRERLAIETTLEADQSADPEYDGQRIFGKITDSALEDEGEGPEMTGTGITGSRSKRSENP